MFASPDRATGDGLAAAAASPSPTQIRLLESLGRPGHVWMVDRTGQAKRKGERAFERPTVESCIQRGWAQRKLIGGHWALILTGKGAECVEAARARREATDGR
ncbi:hypothetical protein [Pleomorphomonas koreensis]|uniref:hypothetical protein n=1 Tax=Pleomorphomonas koreensis TaxID=257440 RepID=UPI000402D6DA|nr:hypothetical protein [Pleomorphomonas koreensis]